MAAQENAVRRAVERAYDQQPAREWERLDRHRTEFAVTLRTLAEHLPPPPARVLDCGGGPGRYAIHLASQGYEVTVFDLSAGCLQLARDKATAAGVQLAGYEHGTALDLSRFPDNSFDAVLLMGPLYHLLGEGERRQAMAEAYRVLKPGGLLFAAFISRYASVRWAAANEPTWIQEHPDQTETILTAGVLPPREEAEGGFVAYFAHPSEARPLCQSAGFEVVTLLGVEGIVSMIEERVNTLSGAAWEMWVDLNYRLATDPSIHSCTEHLLAVATKPRWRAVLRQIAQRLGEAGLTYKAVGGTATALHGVPIGVKDIDLETDDTGALRFQELFAAHTVAPVAWHEGAAYRSYFGRFDFAGVTVEVMGNLERREGERWVPTSATTECVVDLDGVAVHASWLEEETLAYIRRGRLERAAQCLPHCDAGRLLALLRGETRTGVL